MKKEQLRMQMLAGIITEGQYKEKLEEFNANYGPGSATYSGNVDKSLENYNVEETVEHPKGIEAKVYSNGIIELCKNDKRITAYKFSSEFARKRGFEKIKEYFEKNSEKDIDQYDIYNGSGVQYAGTILKIYTSSSDKCGEEGLKTIRWAR